MSNDIIAFISVYNDLAGATRLHKKLSSMGVYSIWADGKFPLFEDDNPTGLSNDGTREYLQDAPKAVLLDFDGHTLPDKMNAMLHMAGEMGYKYAVLFGADEYPEGDFTALTDRLNKINSDTPTVHCLKFETEDENVYRLNHVERVFKWPGRISVKGAHYMFYRDDETEAMRCSPFIYQEVRVIHDHTIRPKKRDDQMTSYQTRRIGEEKAALQAELLGITTEVNYENLKKLYPAHEIDEDISDTGRRIFKIRDRIGFRVDPNKLIHNWKRQRSKDGLVVVA